MVRVAVCILLTLVSCAGNDQIRRLDVLSDELGDRPVAYSRTLIERVRATGELPDVTDVMDRKAHVLAAVVRLRDADLTDYRLATGEQTAPPKTFVRQLAVGYLAHSNLWLNSQEARQVLAERLRDSGDEREQLLLAPVVDALLSSATRRAMALPQAPMSTDFVGGWMSWVEAALERAPDPVTHELVLLRVHAIGRFGAQLGLQARDLFRSIVKRRGVAPLTAGAPGADQDLMRAAIEALYDLDVQARGYHIEPLPRAGTRLDLWATYRDVPLPTHPDADARFDRLAAPLFTQPIRYDKDTHRRVEDAFALRGVDPAKRTKLLSRLLALRAGDVSRFDTTGMDHSYPIVIPDGVPELFTQAARVLAKDPAWIDRDRDVRRTVEALAVRPLDTTGSISNDHSIAILHPVFTRLLRAHVQADRAAGTTILKTWIQSIREVVARTDSHTYYATEVSSGRMMLVAELAPAFGLASEGRAVLDQVIASPLPSPANRNTHAILVRSATIARQLAD
jgi:hypothetical protein